MSGSNTIGIICAVPLEAKLVHDAMKGKHTSGSFVTGRINNKRVVHTVCGIGLVNAAAKATELIIRYKPSVLIMHGIGGAYPGSGLKVGDIVMASSEVYADLGASTGKGFLDLEKLGFELFRKNGKQYFNELPLDTGLIRKAQKLLPSLRAGRFTSVNQATGTLRQARMLRRRWKAVCENMEGAAVVHVALSHGIKTAELRGISNIVEDRDLRKWDRETASIISQQAVMELVGVI